MFVKKIFLRTLNNSQKESEIATLVFEMMKVIHLAYKIWNFIQISGKFILKRSLFLILSCYWHYIENHEDFLMPVNFENNFVSVKFTDSLVEFGEVAYKNMKRYDLSTDLVFHIFEGLSSANFAWSIPEYFVWYIFAVHINLQSSLTFY